MHALAWLEFFLAIAIYGAIAAANGSAAKSQADTDHSLWALLFWVDCGRMVATLSLAVFMLHRNGRQTMELGFPAFAITLLPVIGNVGWYAFGRLASKSDLSIIAPIISLYSAIPIVFHSIRARQRWKHLKVIGTLFSIAALVCLGVSSEKHVVENQDSVWIQVLLFFTVFISWGASDTISSTVRRETTMTWGQIILCNAVGYLLVVSFLGATVLGSTTSGTSFIINGDWGFVLGVNATLPFGWLAYVHLCSEHDASVLVQLFGFYIIIPVISGIIFFGEDFTLLKILGFIFVVLANLAFSRSTIVTNTEDAVV